MFRPKGAVSESERIVLARHREEILAMLAADPVGWRMAVMAAPTGATAGTPLLIARPGMHFRNGSCFSCGDQCPDVKRRCVPCNEAAVRTLATAITGRPTQVSRLT